MCDTPKGSSLDPGKAGDAEMLQLRMNLITSGETPKTAMLAPCKFGIQLEIKMSWAKQFIVNLKALYKLGSMTRSKEIKSPFVYG